MTRRATDHLILALDVSSYAEVRDILDELGPEPWIAKLGLELFIAVGPELPRSIMAGGRRVFLDLKLHDIPTTVGKAARHCAQLSTMFNVHASAGDEALRAAVKSRGSSDVLAVTLLTSLRHEQLVRLGLAADYERPEPPSDEDLARIERARKLHVRSVVAQMASLAYECGAQGVVCSPEEISAIRSTLPAEFKIVTPGVRPAWAAANDQKRTMTPREATALGADYLVVGRPILDPPPEVGSRRRAIELILDEIEQGLVDREAKEA